ncbi:hypothetical protein QFZ43_003274 [Streptomyces afghaniensis]|nr:hypothetical protein [Streptomyces afghaniensis]
MTNWPPELKPQEEKAPRKLRAWKCTSDGPLWGAVLLLVIWGSAVAFITSSLMQGSGSP